MPAVRAGNGKFVKSTNPIALMAVTVANAKRAAEEQRRAARRRNGYRGPLTRADLSAR